MTACLLLQGCIVKTTRNVCRRAGIQITRLPAYGRLILPSCCMHTRTAIWMLPGCSGRFSNCMYAHPAALHCPAAAAGFQTASKRSAVTVMQWQDTKLNARMRAAAMLQWQNIKLHARVAALLQWQVLKLFN
jgi:hypothetical protein